MQESLLTYIDLIQEAADYSEISVMESMVDTYMKHCRLIENCEDYDISLFDDSIITEASTDATNVTASKKKNILRWLIEKIGGFFKWIGRMILKVINMIVGLFKKKTKPVDQIAEECGVKPSTDSNINKPGAKIKRKFKIRENGAYRDESIEAVVRDLSIRMSDDNETFNIHVYYNGRWAIANEVIDDGQHVKSSYAKMPEGAQNWVWFYIIMTSPNFFPVLDKLLNSIISNINDPSNDAASLESLYYDFKREFPESVRVTNPSQYAEFKISRLKEVQKDLAKSGGIFNSISIPDDMSDDKLAIATKLMNYIYNQMMNWQQSINIVSRNFWKIYNIDARYVGSIKDYKSLAIFVKKLIENGVAPRYVIENTLMVSDPKIGGSECQIGAGQTRCALIGNDKKYIHKFAMNTVGITANRNEYAITKAMGSGGDGIIAKSDESLENGVIIRQQRAKIEPPKLHEKEHVIEKLDAYYDSHPNFPYRIKDISVAHDGQFGYVNGELVILDYGWINRVSQ